MVLFQKIMVRKSKRKPRKSFIDEDDTGENSNSNMEVDFDGNVGEEGIGGEEELEIRGSQQGEVLPHGMQKQQEQIPHWVNAGAQENENFEPIKPNVGDIDESITTTSLDETMKLEVADGIEKGNDLSLEMSMLNRREDGRFIEEFL